MECMLIWSNSYRRSSVNPDHIHFTASASYWGSTHNYSFWYLIYSVCLYIKCIWFFICNKMQNYAITLHALCRKCWNFVESHNNSYVFLSDNLFMQKWKINFMKYEWRLFLFKFPISCVTLYAWCESATDQVTMNYQQEMSQCNWE